MTAPHYEPCCVCQEHLEEHELTVAIGEDHAHDACADDPLYVRRCADCGELVLVGEDGLWTEDRDGWLCPQCVASRKEDHAEPAPCCCDEPSALAPAIAEFDALIEMTRELAGEVNRAG